MTTDTMKFALIAGRDRANEIIGNLKLGKTSREGATGHLRVIERELEKLV
jgi:hypothetical protein